METFSGKVGLVQRVVPHYRACFFNVLGRACSGGLSIFAGKPRPDEMIKSVDNLEDADLRRGKNLHLFNGSLYLCIQLGLMDWLRDWNPDALIVEANPRYLRTPAALQWMHQRGRVVIGWGLGAPPLSGPLAPFRRKRRQAFIEQFDILITYSQTGAAEYAALGFPEERIYIAVNAITPAPAHPLPKREPLGKGQKPRVLFVGRLQERKNLDNLIQACAQLPESIKPELVIVGDGPAREQLEALAEEIYPATTFAGALYWDALAEQFRAADLFVLPGTGGLAVQQAMSYGLPVIAAEADGTQADLLRPENGWQIPADDVPALTAALQDALSDIAHIREMGAESYRIVAEEINLDQMAEVFIQALKESSR